MRQKPFVHTAVIRLTLNARAAASEFELTRNTDNFTKSFFNEVLSDMELNISETPDPPVRPESGPDRSAPENVVKWGGTLGVLLLLAMIVVILFLILR